MLEFLKEKTIQYEFELIRKRLSDHLMKDVFKADKSFKKREILNKDILDSTDLAELKKFLDKNKHKLVDNLYDYCIEEYKEIKRDLKWENSKKGKAIMEIEAWVRTTRRDLAANNIENVLIGRKKSEPKVLLIGGDVKSESEKKELIEKFTALAPPAEPIYKFDIVE